MDRIVNKVLLDVIKQLVSGNEVDTGAIADAQKTVSCELTKAKILGEPTAELEASLAELAKLNEILG